MPNAKLATEQQSDPQDIVKIKNKKELYQMQRVYGEFDVNGTTSDDLVPAIREYEVNLGLDEVPKNFVLRKLGIKVSAACDVAINGRDFSINEKEPLEFGYDAIKVSSIVFKTTGLNAVVRYMYFKEDKVYQ